MKLLASLFVGKPLHVLAVAAAFVAGFLGLRATVVGAARHPHMLLRAALGWLLYAAWEWLVQVRTPEANIRVDLLVIWPVLAILSAWAIFRSLRWDRRPRGPRPWARWYPPMRIVAVALGITVLGAAGVRAELEYGEALCQAKASLVGWQFFSKKMACLNACRRGVFEGTTPASDCEAPYPPGATAGCIAASEGKATAGVCKACASNPPECYPGNCSTTIDPLIAQIEAIVDAAISPAVFCDDTASDDGVTPYEYKCQAATAKYASKLAYAKAKCLAKCRRYVAEGALAAGSCVAPYEPATAACVAKYEVYTAAALAKYCSTDAPECYTSMPPPAWVGLVGALVDGCDAAFYCTEP